MSCDGGLHVWPRDVNQVVEVDLECREEVKECMMCLNWAPRTETAKVVRLVVYGFAGTRICPLFLMCQCFPLLHEIVLPDRKKEAKLFTDLCVLIEELAESNPRLQHVIFEDAQVQAISWKTLPSEGRLLSSPSGIVDYMGYTQGPTTATVFQESQALPAD